MILSSSSFVKSLKAKHTIELYAKFTHVYITLHQLTPNESNIAVNENEYV